MATGLKVKVMQYLVNRPKVLVSVWTSATPLDPGARVASLLTNTYPRATPSAPFAPAGPVGPCAPVAPVSPGRDLARCLWGRDQVTGSVWTPTLVMVLSALIARL